MIDFHDTNPLFLKHLQQLRDEKWYRLEHLGGIDFQDQCIAHLLAGILKKEGLQSKVSRKMVRQTLYDIDTYPENHQTNLLKETYNYFVQVGEQVFSPTLGITASLAQMSKIMLAYEDQEYQRFEGNLGTKTGSMFEYIEDPGLDFDHIRTVGLHEKIKRFSPVLLACLRKTPLFEQNPQPEPLFNLGDNQLTFLPEDLQKKSLLKPDHESNLYAVLLRRLESAGYPTALYQRTVLVLNEETGRWHGTERQVMKIQGIDHLITLGQPNDYRKCIAYNNGLVQRLWGKDQEHDLSTGQITAFTAKPPSLRRLISAMPIDQQSLQEHLFVELKSFIQQQELQQMTTWSSRQKFGSRM